MEKLHCKVGKTNNPANCYWGRKKSRTGAAYQRPTFWEKTSLNPEEGRILCRASNILLTTPSCRSWAPSYGENWAQWIENEHNNRNPRLQQCCEAVTKTNPEHISLNKSDWHRQLSVNCDFRNSRNDSKPRELYVWKCLRKSFLSVHSQLRGIWNSDPKSCFALQKIWLIFSHLHEQLDFDWLSFLGGQRKNCVCWQNSLKSCMVLFYL